MNASERAFIKAVKSELGEYGMKLVLARSKFVFADQASCWGFFDQKKIKVARGNPRWIEVVAHEYSHFLQWLVGSKSYSLCFGPMGDYAEIQDQWLKGKKFEARRIRKAFDAVRAMERECEMITVEVMKDYGLDVDIDRYKQEANCYIYIHHLMEIHRKRLDNFKKDPLIPYYIRKMPASFRQHSHQTLPKKVEEILARCV